MHCIMAWKEYKMRSDAVFSNLVQQLQMFQKKELTIYLYLMQQWTPHSTANPLHLPKHTLHSGRTYTVWNSSSGGSSVCADTLSLHVWVTEKLLLFHPDIIHQNCSHSMARMCVALCHTFKEGMHLYTHCFCPCVTLSLYTCWITQHFSIFTPGRVRRHVLTGRTKVLCSHSAQCWWQGYGCWVSCPHTYLDARTAIYILYLYIE